MKEIFGKLLVGLIILAMIQPAYGWGSWPSKADCTAAGCGNPSSQCNQRTQDWTCDCKPAYVDTGTACVACGPGESTCNNVCVNLNTDTDNCGSCGTTCGAPANGAATCTSGACGFTCNAGYTKCGSYCVDLITDINHCGTCGHICTPPANGVATCTAGACGFTCNAGYKPCGNACIPEASCCDASDCTTPPDACHTATGATCDNGVCNYPAVPPTDGGWTAWSACSAACNGVQTRTCTNPTPACGGANCIGKSTRSCNPVDYQIDLKNCGSCGNVCITPTNGAVTCTAGVCVISCNAGYKPCGNACIPTAACCDASDCTTPPDACHTATGATCDNGQCNYPAVPPTDGGWTAWSTCSAACNGVQTRTCTNPTPACGGADCIGKSTRNCNVVDYQIDLKNCGSCGNVCTTPANGVATCTAGACGFTCNAGYKPCGNACIPVASCCDASDCTSTPDRCHTINGATCDNGVCKYPLLPSKPTATMCSGKCVNLNTDRNNCGTCGNICPTNYICSATVQINGHSTCIPNTKLPGM